MIELVIVIVILGILAVIAAPRFLDLQGDARAGTMAGIEGSLKEAVDIVYAKAVAENKHKEFQSAIVWDGEVIPIRYGYVMLEIGGRVYNSLLSSDIDFENAEEYGYQLSYPLWESARTTSTVRLANLKARDPAMCYIDYTDVTLTPDYKVDEPSKVTSEYSGC